jgi:hypothetical protein
MIARTSLVCGDGNDNIVDTQHIEYTDFPIDEITLQFANNVIYLERALTQQARPGGRPARACLLSEVSFQHAAKAWERRFTTLDSF